MQGGRCVARSVLLGCQAQTDREYRWRSLEALRTVDVTCPKASLFPSPPSQTRSQSAQRGMWEDRGIV
jgi:hypothetical protein